MLAILGASGFIGRSVADHLAAQDFPYAALVRKPDTAPIGTFPKAERIQAFEIGHNMNMRVFDQVKTVLLAAWATKPNQRETDEVDEYKRNILPYRQLMQKLHKTDVNHVIFLSSGGTVYGNVDQSTSIREDQVCNPCTPYGYGKLSVEEAIQTTWVGPQRRYTIIRPSNPVGPHQMQSVGQHGLFPSVIHALIKDAPVQIFGDGTAVRDYFAAEDLATLIHAVATQDRGNQIVNASSGSGLSINEVVAICAKATGIPPKIRRVAAKQLAIQHNVLDSGRARAVFGWSARRPISDVAQELAQALQIS